METDEIIRTSLQQILEAEKLRKILEDSIRKSTKLKRIEDIFWINRVTRNIPPKLLPRFVEALETKVLNLTSKELTNADVADYIIHFLDLNPQIVSLRVCYNRIDAFGAKLLAANQTLKDLNISGNPIHDEGASHLSENETLETLVAGNCRITSYGALFLARNKTIKHLGLGTNSISSRGAAYLARNVHLKTLDLCKNEIINTQALARNETLTELNVWDNSLNALSMILLYQMNNYRKDKYKCEKWAFLSCMTAIDEKDIIRKTSNPQTLRENYHQAYARARMMGSNKEKQEKSLLFSYRNAHPYHRLCNEVLKEVFSFLKPVRIKINNCQERIHVPHTPTFTFEPSGP